MGYYIDLSDISLHEYKRRLKTRYLVPSRQLLRENIDAVFDILSAKGISNVEELLKALKSKKHVEQFASENDISKEYLTVLAREIKSNHPNPVKLKDFTGVNEKLVNKLEEIGIKTTVQLYEKVKTINGRKELEKSLDCDKNDLYLLSQLSDLCRIRWVNHTFAYMLLQAGFDSIQSIVEANYSILHTAINKLNKEKGFYKGSLGLNDMKLLVEVAVDVPQEMEV